MRPSCEVDWPILSSVRVIRNRLDLHELQLFRFGEWKLELDIYL
jgi:hypothetical protein